MCANTSQEYIRYSQQSPQPQNAPLNSHWAYSRLEPTYKTKQTTPVSTWWSPWSPGQGHQSCWTAENDQQMTQEGPSKRSVLSFLYIPCFFLSMCDDVSLVNSTDSIPCPHRKTTTGGEPNWEANPKALWSNWLEGNSWFQWTYSPWLQSSNQNAFD